MRAFFIFAILGVAFGRDAGRGLCRGVRRAEIDNVFRTARVGATAILGESCPSFNIDEVAFNGECRELVEQATCYSIRASKLYEVDVVDYGLLRSDVGNMERLGNLACERTEACFRQVQVAMEACLIENEDFVRDTIDAAERLYRETFEETVADFASKNKGSLLGDLVNMAMDQFTSAEDIQSFIQTQLIEDPRIEEDARRAATEARDLAERFCSSGCVSKTADFLRGIFRRMDGGQCTDASRFCGACERRADKYFDNGDLPCCVEDVVQRSIEAYDYVVEAYEDTLTRYASAIEEGLSAEAIREAREIRDRMLAEFECVSDVYTENRPTCA